MPDNLRVRRVRMRDRTRSLASVVISGMHRAGLSGEGSDEKREDVGRTPRRTRTRGGRWMAGK